MEFSHSEVLFAGDDGLPILFNIQNTTEKESLKAHIEYGGGLCTLNDEAIILVSPGTKVLSFLANKKLISSCYIFDCVKEDCLLETDEYRIEINEMEASDFSDSSNLPVNSLNLEDNKKLPCDTNDYSIDPCTTLTPHKICPNSSHDFDFQDTENCDVVAEAHNNDELSNSHLEFPLQSSENHIHFSMPMGKADKANEKELMMEFSHSEVLFAGDDGLPIQFNIQNTTEKEFLKALIEYGGGLCTLSDEAIILVSPGTKVLTFLANKKLISSRYIFDCVKEDCLLDVDEYQIEINEMEASDFSDSSNLPVNFLNRENNKKSSNTMHDNLIDAPRTLPLHKICSNSNHNFDFQDTENRDIVAKAHNSDEQCNSHLEFPLKSSENHIRFDMLMGNADNLQSCADAVPDSLEVGQKRILSQKCKNIENHTILNGGDNSAVAVVSSSQENHIALNEFDNMIHNKVQEKNDDDAPSQSYTVSSSADAQIAPNQSPSHHTSAEMFNGSSTAPDSASQTTERQQYIKDLEKDVEQILLKPSPKSLQDKIVLVKYICTVKKLPPAIVLQTLQKKF